MSKNEKGFTLIEILVATIAVGVGFVALASVTLMGFREYQNSKDMYAARQAAYELEYTLRRVIGQAVAVTTPVLGWSNTYSGLPPDYFGRMRDYRLTSISPPPPGPAFQTLAVFLREGAKGVNSGLGLPPRSEFLSTGIYFLRPTPTTSGVVFIDLGGEPPGAPFGPDYSDHFFDRITEFEMTNYRISGNRVVSVNIRFVIRYHRNGSEGMNWCPHGDMAPTGPCNAPARFFDEERAFRVTLRNNDLGQMGGSSSINLRPLGHLYFFDEVNPYVWR